MLASEFEYDLPSERIAQSAIEPRHDARLLLSDSLVDIRFLDLVSVLRPGDCLVVNTTKVRHARLTGTRMQTGGRIEMLLTKRLDDLRWEAMTRPSRRLRSGTEIVVGPLIATLLSDPTDGVATISLTPVDGVEEAIADFGEVPLPPYFTGTLDDADRYQSIFAQTVGSAAAPTASLHFTPELVASVASAGVRIAEVELDVGLDTFRPMSTARVADHIMHAERIVVPPEAVATVNATCDSGGRIIAVGTTVVRTLESASDERGRLHPYMGETELFIMPGYRPRIVDAVITNFHAPRTTLLVLVAALLGDRWREVYAAALGRGLRFLSFGDAMFFEVRRD